MNIDYNILMVISGILWSITYALVIFKGFKDKTFAMPMIAVCLNISWEVIFTFIYMSPAPQIYVNVIWLLLDVLIFWQFLRFGRSEYKLLTWQFYLMFLSTLIISFLGLFIVSYTFVGYVSELIGAYTSFGINLVMSYLFIDMFFSRKSMRGQSVYIAVFKMFGTGIASIAFYLYQPIIYNFLLQFLFVAIFILDLIYTLLVLLLSRSKIHFDL